MRLVGLILLFLLPHSIFGQSDTVILLTPEKAIMLAARNNPTIRHDDQKKALRRDVRSAYFFWLYQISKMKVISEQLSLYYDVDRVATLRYLAGDIELQEKNTAVYRLAELRLSKSMLADEIEITKNRLSQLLYLDNELMPADTSVYMVQIIKTAASPTDTITTQDRTRKHGKCKRAEQEADAARKTYLAFVRNKTIENLMLELNSLFKKLQFYHFTGLALADQIIDTSAVKYKKEDIDYPEYMESINNAFSIREGYLETLDQYNQTAIQLEFYAY